MAHSKDYEHAENLTVLVGYAPLDAGSPPPAKGSKARSCEVCDRTVWLTESSCELLARFPKARILCMPCALPVIGTDPNPTLLVPSAEHLKRDFGVSDSQAQTLLKYGSQVRDGMLRKAKGEWLWKNPAKKIQ